MTQDYFKECPDKGCFLFAVPAIVPTKTGTHFLGYIVTEENEATVRIYIEPIYPEQEEGEAK